MTDPEFAIGCYPNLSRMYLTRYVDTAQGQEPESLGCILRLLGVKKVPAHLRGYAEALGYGIPVNTNDLILRGSWFALDENGCITVPVSAPETLQGADICRYYHLEQYKSLLVFPGIKDPKVLNKKIAYGTQNIAKGPAMKRAQAEQAILIGYELAKATDADVIGIGEMGIGNTTTSSAVLSVLLDADVDAVTGRGGGITDQSFLKKKQVIKDAIAINAPNKDDVVDVLEKVGGFDIAAMCGAFLGCAAKHTPVVIDGFISAVAALCAYKLYPNSVRYFIPSHASYEIGYKLAMDAMHLQPLFLLGMRLGEGSGCPLTFEILDAACAIINDMATFDQAGIDDGYLDEIREGDKFTVEDAK